MTNICGLCVSHRQNPAGRKARGNQNQRPPAAKWACRRLALTAGSGAGRSFRQRGRSQSKVVLCLHGCGRRPPPGAFLRCCGLFFAASPDLQTQKGGRSRALLRSLIFSAYLPAAVFVRILPMIAPTAIRPTDFAVSPPSRPSSRRGSGWSWLLRRGAGS